MLIVPIAALPNQTFDVLIGDNDWEFALYVVNDFNLMGVDITLNGKVILTGQRCVPLQFLIPYNYLAPGIGNFFFSTVNDDYPDYAKFNVSQQLLYATAAEIEAPNALDV